MDLMQLREQYGETILRISASYGARNVRVFGSVVRGEVQLNSDLGLLITLDPDRSLLDLIAIKQDIEDLVGCPVEVVTEAAISSYVRERVLQEAVRL